MIHQAHEVAAPASGVIELSPSFDANRFLAALDREDRVALASHLKLVHVKSGQVLCEPGDTLPAVYLPVTTAVSLQYVSSGGMTLEVAEIGSEGIVCDEVIGGSGTMPCRAVACRDGFAYRLDPHAFAAAFDASAVIRHLLFVCLRLLIAQVSQITFCSRHHVLKHQLCRWFLLAYDRSRSIEIQVTHSMLAQMLGVRRETITDAAGEIQKLGLIRQYRSSIELADLPGLDRMACGCRGLVRDEMKRILSADTGVPAASRS
ncbi:Crp/Fnr family transcriptional regulator [Burkholderia stagnalis]|uniref:Crp/Fnr family transcriptional regulator n=1 Tax=Burkholderia stagnalis TaxID=1503054 RepID=A0A105ZST9_9BURK|nr:Crp/Fnr family transcriptional regulator [Burkholderia stagnalis]AOK56093.1 Crp/Fnr family transcriptional regulator [Burkholderia stagnalis]KAB0632373.1 Crp/Fnr family transcriptional regulator [Burkholderia stagnalis]KVC57743.1 Crp/Fnr family transcriptional regulator [Burkholderia stagnalis]KVM79951.1 Crp/Fnr family transcriptional regulator [Burkholderia stagnalis]KVM93036.1 Crp/Fnr family transcriptional regulator [Burkholderia stagnalis]